MARTKVGEHVRASEDGSEALSQGSDHRAVAGGVKEHAVGALDVVASAKGGKGGVGGSGAAGGADEGGVLLRSRRREGKKVESEAVAKAAEGWKAKSGAVASGRRWATGTRRQKEKGPRATLPSRKRARPRGEEASYRDRNANDETTAEAAR